MLKKILVVEDDLDINNLIAKALTSAGYECVQTFSGKEALTCIDKTQFALIILDLMLPEINGEALLHHIREKITTPVIIVSARDDLDGKINLLTAGAEDYLTKPFEVDELIARVGVQMRRLPAQEENTESGILRYRDLVLDSNNYSVYVAGRELTFTRQEFKILELMLKNPPGRVFSKHNIYEYAWDGAYFGADKTINVHISNIRKKLKAATNAEYIETVWGVGFRLCK